MKRTNRFAEASRRKHVVTGIFRRYQHNVEVAGQGAVLKAIIEQMQLRPKLSFGINPGLVTFLSEHYIHTQPARDQARLGTEIASPSSRIDSRHTHSAPPISAPKSIQLNIATPHALPAQQEQC